MKIEVRFNSLFDRILAICILLSVMLSGALLVVFLTPDKASAEWDSSSSFGDSYYLERISIAIEDCAEELDNISYTLDSIERNL